MESWKAAGTGSGGDGAFPCLRSTPRGRIFHCPEFRRVVIDFLGAYLVLRQGEFLRLREHFRRIAGCGLARARLQGGECIRLRDASGYEALVLRLPEIQELAELMEIGAFRPEITVSAGVWQDA
jgi:hypothetical protein